MIISSSLPVSSSGGVWRVAHANRLLLSMLWRAHRKELVHIVALRLLRLPIPVSLLWIGRAVLDSVVASSADRHPSPDLWKYLIVESAILLLGEGLGRYSAYVEMRLIGAADETITISLTNAVRRRSALDLERPDEMEALERARQRGVGKAQSVLNVIVIAFESAVAVSLVAALSSVSVVLVIALLSSIVPSAIAESRYVRRFHNISTRQVEEARRADYLRELLTSGSAARELRAIGIGDQLSRLFRGLIARMRAEREEAQAQRSKVGWGLSFVSTATYYGVYATLVLEVASGTLSVGGLTMSVMAMVRLRDQVQRVLALGNDLAAQALQVEDFVAYISEAAPTPSRRVMRTVVPAQPLLQLRDAGVSRDGKTWALRHISLDIAPGSRIAVSGANGSGKSTLIALICGVYPPTEGEVLLNGVPLSDYDEDTRACLFGVLFQDFLRFELTLADNVFPRRTLSASAECIDAEELRQALGALESADLLDRMPQRGLQQLGLRFRGGRGLSGGEWQRIALARTLISGAPFLLFDEPTSMIDAHSAPSVRTAIRKRRSEQAVLVVAHDEALLAEMTVRYRLENSSLVRIVGPTVAARG